jgi:hypothetical protein
MSIRWAAEACDRRDDPESGARIVQLTSSAAVSNNIYGEQPYTSPNGNRVAIIRRADFSFSAGGMLLVADLTTLKIALIEAEGVTGCCNAAWSGWLYYGTLRGDTMRVNLETFEKEVVNLGALGTGEAGSSVSPDMRYMIRSKILPGPTIGIERMDMVERKSEIIFQHPELVNPHLQFNPVHGKQILVQHNRGSRFDASGNITRDTDDLGTTLFTIDLDGSNQTPLPVGEPVTFGATGHECFIADTGKVLFSCAWKHPSWELDQRFPEGNMFIATPGDKKPQVIKAPEHRFNHVSASKCGKYWVADSHPAGGLFKDGEVQRVALVVGNVATGKHRVLVRDTLGSGGGNQSTHSHPYMTADNGAVIFNADPYYSAGQVFAARIPAGFLKSLD